MRGAFYSDKWYVDGLEGPKGPFSTQELLEKLISNELEITDRVSKDPKNLASWITICNETHFDKAINDMIATYVSQGADDPITQNGKTKSLDEHSGFSNITNIRKGISTQLQKAKTMEEIVARAATLRQLLVQIQSKRKIVIEVRDEAKKDLSPDDSVQVVRFQKRARTSFVESQQKIAQYRKWAMIGGIGFLVFGVLFKGIKGTFAETEDDVRAAQIQSQLEQISETTPSLDIKGESIPKKEKIFQANFNQAIQALAANEISVATTYLKEAWKQMDKNVIGPLLLVSFEAAWKADLEEQKTQSHQEYPRIYAFQQTIRQFEKSAQPYAEEIMLMKIISASLLGEKDQFAALTISWLEMEPHYVPPKPILSGLDERRNRWNHLYFWCLDVYKHESKSAFANVFFANCLSKSKSQNEAYPYVAYAFKVMPQQPQIKGMMVNMLYALGRAEVAKKLVLSRSPANTKHSRLMQKTILAICKTDSNAKFCK